MSVGLIKDRQLKEFLSRKAIPDSKKISDGEGLYIHLRPLKDRLGMYWKYDYVYAGKRRTISYGTYPLINISKARELHREAKIQLSNGNDPAAIKKSKKEVLQTTFADIANEWASLPQNSQRWSDSYAAKVKRIFERDVFPVFGRHSVEAVIPAEIVGVIRSIDGRGASTQAQLALQIIRTVFKYAMTLGLVKSNPADIDINMLIAPRVKKAFATLTDPTEIGQLLRNIDGYQGYIQTRIALKLSPMLMLRPNELRRARWVEIDLEEALYIIPARRMKARQHIKEANRKQDAHIVPLPRQAVELLKELHMYTGQYTYVFPRSNAPNHQYISDHTLPVALRNMGYTPEQMTVHGFRAMASTLLNQMRLENGSPRFNPDAIEKQLAHVDKNQVRRAYNRSDYLEERREMLQFWADYLDELKLSAK